MLCAMHTQVHFKKIRNIPKLIDIYLPIEHVLVPYRCNGLYA